MNSKAVSVCLKVLTIVSAFTGILMSALAGRIAFMGGNTVFMYFTVQSNIAVAVLALIGLCFFLTKKKPGRAWDVIELVGTVAITLTGVVFCFVLAPTLGDKAWNLQNTLTHVVVPVATIADFFVMAKEYDIKKRSVLWVVVPPILYAIYAGIGYVQGWEFYPGSNYPYFFLNWGSPAGAFGFSSELPFMGTAWWIAAIMLFLIGIGHCYLFIANKIKKKALSKINNRV